MRYRSQWPRDRATEPIGDTGFVGVNSRVEPHLLPPGYVSEAINTRFNRGIAETRLGMTFPPWLNKITIGTISISSITRSGTTATVTTASNHGLATNSIAIISGATLVISSLTRSGSTATAVTASAHGLNTNDIVTVSGATQTEYNGSFPVTVTNTTTFTYTVTGTPATPATGSPVINRSKYNGSFAVTVTGATTFTYTVTGSPATPATGTLVLQTRIIAPWGTVYGVGVFNDPTSFTDYLVIAADGNVYFTEANNVAQAMTLPAGITVTENVTFTQAFDTLVMFRGDDDDELQTTGVNTAWNYIAMTPAGTGTQPIPRAKRALFFQNRLVIPTKDDLLAFSDFGDYTRYLPVAQELRINQGSSDRIVNIKKFNDVTVVIFKDRSIYALNNIYGDLAAAQLDMLTDQFGLLAAKSVAHCGADLLFLGQHGVMSIRQTEQNKLQSVTLPLSDPIQPIIDRINWNYASTAVAAYWNNRYYLAVPLDAAESFGPELLLDQATYGTSTNTITVRGLVVGNTYRWQPNGGTQLSNNNTVYYNAIDFVAAATSVIITGTGGNAVEDSLREVHKGINNAVLVYDFLNQAWSGYDEADDFDVKDFFLFPHNGRDRLFFVTHNGWIGLYEEDFEDQLAVPYTEVTVASAPSVGNTIRINTGDTITAINASTNTATQWGVSSLAAAQQNLFQVNNPESASWYSYSAFQSPSWSAPNTYAFLNGTGTVRFYSTNGLLPVVSYTGSWATITYAGTQQIESTLITRGYAHPEGDLSDFRWLEMDIQTWNPKYTIDLLTDGVKEEFSQCTDRTKDRTKWYTPFDKADFDVNNGDGRFMDKWRQDYSVALGSASPAASALNVDATSGGVSVDKHQETREGFRVLPTGRSCRVRVVSEQGRIRLAGIKLLAQKDYDSALINS